jgi:polyphosphate kinase
MATNDDGRYFNRELSWLEFNRRVLHEARADDQPLLERVKFLAITGSNLDEFFQVRVGSLKLQLAQKLEQGLNDTADLRGELAALHRQVCEFYREQEQVLLNELEPALAERGIRRLPPSAWSKNQVEFIKRQFDDLIRSVVAPLGIDREGDFPMLAGAPLCLCVRLKTDAVPLTPHRLATVDASDPLDRDLGFRYAVIPLGRSLKRLWTLPSDSGYHYVLLEDVVAMFARDLFPDQEVVEAIPFRVARNADLALEEEGARDLLAEVEQLLEARRISNCVRLELDASASPETRAFLRDSLRIGDEDIIDCRGPIDVSAFMKLTQLQGHTDLKDEPWPPQDSADFPPGSDVFQVIAQRDRLLVHPYQTFDPVVRFVRAAADDPDVLAIKQTLYRTARNSAVVAALRDAARAGKAVTTIVELKARFDEARNIAWAKQMEAAGIDVIYGLRGLKVHSKICVVVRREPEGIRRYVHLGTGNYNEATARVYSDISLFSADAQLGDDAIRFFNATAGFSAPLGMRKLTMAPLGLRERILELIEIETIAAQAGEPARIALKLNSLVDRQVIDALYAASNAGVDILLNVRGICCLRPGVKGLSENIRVVSIVDRFLEHSRIFRFLHKGDDLILIGSADLMPRNLDGRVELLVEVDDRDCKAALARLLETYFQDTVKAYELKPDGNYHRKPPAKKGARRRAQQSLYLDFRDQYERATNPQAKIFRPIRGEAEGV